MLYDNVLCYEYLLEKPGKVKMRVLRPIILCIQTYKTVNSLSKFCEQYIQNENVSRLPRDKYKPNLDISKCNQVTFGAKSLNVCGSKVWNSLPYHIKVSKSFEVFKIITKN